MSKFERSVFENVKAEYKRLANQGANYRTLANYVEGVIDFYKKTRQFDKFDQRFTKSA